jgi:hypothetical protein
VVNDTVYGGRETDVVGSSSVLSDMKQQVLSAQTSTMQVAPLGIGGGGLSHSGVKTLAADFHGGESEDEFMPLCR